MFDMKLYIPEPNQCYKCQKYGHIARVCTAQSPRCCLCEETHLSKLCQEKKEKNKDKKIKCANCGKEHHASSTKCQKRKEVARALIERMPAIPCPGQKKQRVPGGVDFPKMIKSNNDDDVTKVKEGYAKAMNAVP